MSDNKLEPLLEIISRSLENKSQELNFSGQGINDFCLSEVIEEIIKHPKLEVKELNLNHNQLTELPSNISKLVHLEKLYIDDNQLRDLTSELASLENLTKLSLNDNKLNELPSEFSSLVKLKEVYLSNNRLKKIPENFGNLLELEILYLNSNELEQLPQSFSDLNNLVILNLEKNQLNNILLNSNTDKNKLTKLKELNLNYNGLNGLSPKIANLTNLERLYLNGQRDQENNLTLNEIPEQISSLQKLTKLSINDNGLTSLPENFGKLQELEELYIINNKLNALPSSIFQLKKLKKLYVSDNNLSSLNQRYVGSSESLEELHLLKNNLKTFPSSWCQLSNLKTLSLAENSIEELPIEIGLLGNLQNLHLDKNKLENLPLEIGLLKNLKYITLSDNPLTKITKDSALLEKIKENNNNTIGYFQERLKEQQSQWIGKLIVVGQGRVGKTSMLKVLRGENYDDEEDPTHKIEIKTLEIEHPEEKNINLQLNCWDFGAQDIYRATHQFFLTDRSLFLLIWDARVGWEQSNGKYWLKTINRIAPEAPIILVANKIDEFPNPSIPEGELKTNFPQIQYFLEISCKKHIESEKIEELRKKIAECAVNLSVMGELLPSTWIDAIKGIRETSNNVPFLTIEDFVSKLAFEFKVLPNSVKILMEYLHDIGNIIYFPENSELNNYVILDPQWVSEYISKILDDKEVKENNGILTLECKQRIWKGIDISSQNVLTSIIKQLELGCSIENTNEHILIVERITQGKPAECVEKWNAINHDTEISIKFKFDTDIPKGMPGYFIARTNKYSTGLYWASGVLLTDSGKEDNLALLEVFRDKRYVQLTVRGLNPKDFFDELKFIIENIFSRFKGAKIIRKVPCPGHENNQPCEMQGEFDYYKLKRDREFGKTFSRCPVTDKKVPILKLLDGSSNPDIRDLILENEHKFPKYFTLYLCEESEHNKKWNFFGLGHYYRKYIKQELELQLYCEYKWHPPQDKNGKKIGYYKFTKSPQWLNDISPYINGTINLFKIFLPLKHINGVFEIIGEDLEKSSELIDSLNLMGELVKNINNEQDLEVETNNNQEIQSLRGMPLRMFEDLLKQLDPGRKWGGLARCKNPNDQGFIWVCEECRKQHKQHFN